MVGSARIEGWLSRVLVVLLPATTVLTILALSFDRPTIWGTLAVTAGVLTGHVLAYMAYSHVWRRGRLRWLMGAGMLLGAVSLVAWLYLIWNLAVWGSADAEWIPLTILWHFALVIIGLLAVVPTASPWVTAMKLVSSVLVAAMAITISMAVTSWPGIEVSPEVILTLVPAAIVSTLLVPLLNRSAQQDPEPNSGPVLRSSARCTIECPRCAQRQGVPRGESRCTRCGLKLTLDFHEPACACGYPTFGLTSENCPECGLLIPAADRWRGSGSAAALTPHQPSPQSAAPAGEPNRSERT